MPLETFGFIDSLNASNPVGATDPKSQGDDHLRGIKSTLLATFPNIAGAMTLTHTQLNNAAIKTEANVFSASQRIEAANAGLFLKETDAPADNGVWQVRANNQNLSCFAANDAESVFTAFMSVERTGTSIDHVTLLQGIVARLRTVSLGQLNLYSDGDSDTEQRRMSFMHQDGTQRGFVGYTGSQQLNLYNQVHGGRVDLVGEDVGGAARTILFGDPDGAATLAYAGISKFATASTGAWLRGNDSAAIGTNQNIRLILENLAGTDIGRIGYFSSAHLEVRNMNHGGQVQLVGEDAGGTARSILVGDPDGAADLYYNGTQKLRTISEGIRVQSQGSADTEIRILQLCHANGTERGRVGHESASLYIRNTIHGGIFRVTGEDSGGVARILFDGDPDGGCEMTYAGVDAIRTIDRAANGQTSSAEVSDHGGSFHDVGFNLLPLKNYNTSDTLEADHCGKVNLLDSGTATLTLEASTGSDFPITGVTHIQNNHASNDYTVTEGTGVTLHALVPGAGLVDTTGGCTVGPGGFATIRRTAAGTYHITGSEISYTP